MIRVQVRPNETLEAALRRFKRQCNYAGIFRMAKKYSYHEKRSDKRRREERERIRNIQRAMRKTERKTKPRAGKKGRMRTRPREPAPGSEANFDINAPFEPAPPGSGLVTSASPAMARPRGGADAAAES